MDHVYIAVTKVGDIPAINTYSEDSIRQNLMTEVNFIDTGFQKVIKENFYILNRFEFNPNRSELSMSKNALIAGKLVSTDNRLGEYESMVGRSIEAGLEKSFR